MDDPVEIQPFLYSEGSPISEKPVESLPNPLNSSYSFSLVCHKQQMHHHAWFDVKVFYIRVSSCLLTEAPDSLFIVYPKRDISTELEINGGRISPSERVCFTLRRDRVDTDSAEAIYVNTNNISTTGDLPFEIYDKDELLVVGSLSRTEVKDHQHVPDAYNSFGTSPWSKEAGWNMECSCAITSYTCYFLKGRVDFSTVNPTMEVYVAGRNSGLPIVLTQIVQLAVRKKSPRGCSLDAIPEEEESHQSYEAISGQISDKDMYSSIPGESPTFGNLYLSDISGYGEGEEGELSWFNAGVRVGVGLGLGMCLGVGLGLGLLMRTYQATTGSFRRRLF